MRNDSVQSTIAQAIGWVLVLLIMINAVDAILRLGGSADLFGPRVRLIMMFSGLILVVAALQWQAMMQRPLKVHNQLALNAADVVHNCMDAIIAMNSNGAIIGLNPAAESMFGQHAMDVIGRSVVDVLVPESLRHEHLSALKRFMNAGSDLFMDRRLDITALHRDGSEFPVELSLTSFEGQQGVVFVAHLRDQTKSQEDRRNVIHDAFHDHLTQLPNRQLFEDRLEMALAHAQRDGHSVAVICLDLDHFKDVNESLGHKAGDTVLQKVAGRLVKLCRDEDTVARSGADEFMMIMPGLRNIPQDAMTVARKIIDGLSIPIVIGEHEIFVPPSLGITTFPSDGYDAGTLIKNSNMAMYRAKEISDNRFALYTPAMNEKALKRLELESSLRKAMLKNEFELFYQPLVSADDGRVLGSEALIRWFKGGQTMISPVEFIPLAEDTGLILPLGLWVLQTAIRQCAEWHGHGFADISVSVNLSAAQFQDRALVKNVDALLRKSRLDPSSLNIEITENTLMQDVDAAIEVMNQLREMGVRISLDDFGTGYSSLNYLKRFPINVIKIDKSFVDDVPHDGQVVAIVKGILSMAHDLGLTVVAEGVETEEQLKFLHEQGCDEIQGYYFSRPLPWGEFMEFLRS